MKGLDQYLLPYIVSQIVGIGMLLAAILNIRLARILFSILFLYAGCYNMFIGLIEPNTYLEFSDLAIPLYRNFINGWFSRYNHIIIPLIAIGQLIISIGMVLKGRWVTMACVGAIIFLVSISPLMVGSAFPFSIIVSAAALLIHQNKALNYIWASGNTTINSQLK